MRHGIVRSLFLLLLTAGGLRAQSGGIPAPVNVRVSDPGIRDPEEVSIAINPRNPNELAAGSNMNFFYSS